MWPVLHLHHLSTHGTESLFQPAFGRQGHVVPWKRSSCLLPQDSHGSITSSLKCPLAHVQGWVAPDFMNFQEAGSLHGHQDRHQAMYSTNYSLTEHAKCDDLQHLVLTRKAHHATPATADLTCWSLVWA